MLPANAGDWLLPIARRAIASQLDVPAHEVDTDQSWLQEQGASFVTLTMGDALRGCIGSLEAHRPLIKDVRCNAMSAAFRDPRFSPVRRVEFDQISIEVSVLSAPERLEFVHRADALARLRPGVDGVILSQGGRRATFLPQVWEQLPAKEDFLAHLARKAGLPPQTLADPWPDDLRIDTYQVSSWQESH